MGQPTSNFPTRDRSADDGRPHSPGPTAGVGLLCLLLVALPTTAVADSSPPDLSGRWAQKMVVTGVSDAPVIGSVTSKTRSLLIVDIDHESDTRLSLHTRVCDIEMTNDTSMVDLVAPRAFVDAVPDERRPGRLEVDDSGAPRLVVPKHVAVVGAKFRDPEAEKLPDDRSHPAVRDTDGDGKPGVTIRVEGVVSGAIYVVQRSWDAWRGTVDEPSHRRVEGTVRWDIEQSVLGSTSMFLNSQPSTRPHPDRSKNWFELVRVDSDTTCDGVLERRDDLFSR